MPRLLRAPRASALGRLAKAAVALIGIAAVTGCGVGSGSSSEGEASLTVTRNFGTDKLLEASVSDPTSSETVTRFLDREAEIETSFGGNFVDAIEGVRGESQDGRRFDWFFFVNGYWSPVGAAEARVRPGDRIWWDHRDWEAAYRVPAVVGSWPQPFKSGYDGEHFTTAILCAASAELCDRAADRFTAVGAELTEARPLRTLPTPSTDSGGSGGELRVLVGQWERLQEDPAAELIQRGPAASGVYARFDPVAEAQQAQLAEPRRSWELVAMGPRGREGDRLGAGAGLVAAVRVGEQQPTWLVTGTDRVGLEAAIDLLSAETLEERYAVATDAERSDLALPVIDTATEEPPDR